MNRRLLPLAAVTAAALTLTAVPAAPAASAAARTVVTRVFDFTATEQVFVVPAGVTRIHISVRGGRGGDSAVASGITKHGGSGAEAAEPVGCSPEPCAWATPAEEVAARRTRRPMRPVSARLTVTRGKKVLQRTTKQLSTKCTVSQRIKITRARLGTRRTTPLVITVRYLGGPRLKPSQRVVRVRAN